MRRFPGNPARGRRLPWGGASAPATAGIITAPAIAYSSQNWQAACKTTFQATLPAAAQQAGAFLFAFAVATSNPYNPGAVVGNISTAETYWENQWQSQTTLYRYGSPNGSWTVAALWATPLNQPPFTLTLDAPNACSWSVFTAAVLGSQTPKFRQGDGSDSHSTIVASLTNPDPGPSVLAESVAIAVGRVGKNNNSAATLNSTPAGWTQLGHHANAGVSDMALAYKSLPAAGDTPGPVTWTANYSGRMQAYTVAIG